MKKLLIALAGAACLFTQITAAKADQLQDIEKRGVIRIAVPQDFPQAFLSPQQSRNSSWPAFVAAMERSLYGDPALQRAGSSAIDTFACFEHSFLKGVQFR